MKFIPSKISTYFRIVGSPEQGSNAFKISEESDAYIDALNCSNIIQGNYPVRFRSDSEGTTSVGCFQSYSFSENIQDTELVYPIASDSVGKIYVYIRLRFSDFLKFKVKLDGVDLHCVDISSQDPYLTIDSDNWVIYKFSLVSHVRKVYELSVVPESSGIQIDSLVVSFNDYLDSETPIIDYLYSTDNNIFSETTIENNFQSPYLTILTKLFVTNDIGDIEEEVAYLGIKTTADSSFREGWSNFEITPLPGYQIDLSYKEYVFGVFVVPSSDSYYLIWDYSDEDPFIDPYSSSVSYKIVNGEFINKGDESQLAIRVYSDRISLDSESCSIQTEPGNEYIKLIEHFSDSVESDPSRNIKIIENDDGTESVELDLPDCIISFIVDQSGSMTWNDHSGFRFDLIKDIAYRFNAGYPGDITYNLLTYQATPIITQFFAILEDEVEDTSDIEEAEFSFFYDPVNGFAGVHVVRKEGSPPVTPLDGEIVASGFFDRLYDDNLDPEKTYYYSVYGRDLNQHFSRAETIEVQSRKRIVPYGIGDLTGIERIGTGVNRDAYTDYMYHMDETYGKTVYDFSFSNINLEYTDNEDVDAIPIWIERGESPQASPDDSEGKGSGIRLNGQSQFLESKEKIIISNESFTIMGWLHPFADEDNSLYGDRCVLSLQNDPTLVFDDPYSVPHYQSNTFLQIIQLNTGEISLSFNGEDFVKSSGVLSPNSWNQFAITLNGNSIKFYINGALDSEYTLSDSFVESIESSILYIGRDRSGIYNGFFGKITEFSFHSTSRSQSYIYDNYLYLTKDNGDRIFTLKFTYPYRDDDIRDVRVKIVRNTQIGSLKYLSDTLSGPDNYGFASGTSAARAVYGSDIGPTHENDGDIIHDGTVTDGITEITVIEDFPSPLSDGQTSLGTQRGFEVYYRAFSQNLIGNWSIPSDSSLVAFSPKILEQEDRPDASLSIVSHAEITPGNKKMYLRWSMPQDENVTNILVYFNGSDDTMSIDPDGNPYNGICVFIGDSESGEFVHRAGRIAQEHSVQGSGGMDVGPVSIEDLQNESIAYYMMVTRDRFGNLSEPIFINGYPKENADESIIPVESVLGVQKQPVDENAISLKWYNPIRIDTFGGLTLSGGSVNGYLTDRVIFYARITDKFGRPFSEAFKVNVKNQRGTHPQGTPNAGKPKAGEVSMKSELYNPYTGEIIEPVDWDQLIEKTTQVTKDGWVRIFMQPSGVPVSILSYIESAVTDVWLEYKTATRLGLGEVAGNPYGFLYKSRKISLNLVNPFKFSLSASTSVEHNCTPFDDYYGNYEYLKMSKGPEICNYDFFGEPCTGEFHGSYVKRNEPYRLTCECSFEDKPLVDGSQVYIEVRDDLAPYCEPVNGFCNRKSDWYYDLGCDCDIYDPTFEDTPSLVLSPLKPVYDFIQNGDSGSVAYLDVAVPEYARTVRAIVYANVNGFIAMETIYLLFEPNLSIEIESRAPLADGIDIARQQASVYFIDPDTGVKTPMEDLTVIKWELIRLRNTIRNRPFYTTSEVQGDRYADGIYDYQIDGVSDNVYFGPAQNVEWKLVEDIEWREDNNGDSISIVVIRKIPEEYIIRATVNYKGILVQAIQPLCIIPFGPPDPEDPLEPATHFLIEHPEAMGGGANPFVQTLWADGIDTAEFDIVRDASLGETEAQTKFFECHNGVASIHGETENWFFTTLPENKPIDVRMGEYPKWIGKDEAYWQYHIDIVHGDSFTFEMDEFGFDFLSSQYVGINKATILTGEENRKRFYVRSNGFVSWSTANPDYRGWRYGCPKCFHCVPTGPRDIPVIYNMSIDGFTSTIQEGREIPVTSMGSWGQGIPPKLIRFKEPLKIEFSHIEVNGEWSEYFLIDGVSYNDLIFKISFSGKRVPDGERCSVYSCGDNPIPIENEFVYVENYSTSRSPYEDQLYWSYVRIRTYPIGPEKRRDSKIFIETNYDKLGTVYRQKVYGISVKYEPIDIPPVVYDIIDLDEITSRPSNQTPFLRSCWSYNTELGATQAEEDSAWTQIPSMNIRRGMCESEYVNGRVYAFGGVTTFGITDQVESWSSLDDSWTSEPSMPKPLFGYNSESDERYIYIIGGISLDDNEELQVQNSVYRFDTETKIWDNMSDIPPIESEFVVQPTGACCVYGEPCFVSTYHECRDAGGIFKGVDSECDDGICELDGGPIVTPDDIHSFGLRYGCAFGNTHLIDGKIHLMCGINLVDSNKFEPIRYSNYIYVYDISIDKWSVSSKIIDDDLTFYNRMNAFSFYEEETGSIHIVSGQGHKLHENGDINEDETFTFTDSFRYNISSSYIIDEYSYDPYSEIDPYSTDDDVSSSTILDSFIPIVRIDDNSYINIPTPKYRGNSTTIESEHYLFGGFIEESEDGPGTVASRKIELVTIDQTTGLFDTDKSLPKSLSGRSYHGMTSDGENSVYIIGGLGTGHAPGYVQIDAQAYSGENAPENADPPPCPFGMLEEDCEDYQENYIPISSLRLDGQSGATIRIRVFDDEGDPIKKQLTCIVTGYLIFTDNVMYGHQLFGFGPPPLSEADRSTLLYPVVFSENEFKINNGTASTRLMPRSEDPLRPISEIKDILNIDRFYQFDIGSFPYNDIMEIIQGELRSPYEIEIRIKIVDDFYYGSTIDRGDDDLYGGEGSDGVVYFPEQDQIDIIANAEDWDNAELISDFQIKDATGANIGIALTSSKIAMIAPKYDSDLFYFNTWDPGGYYFTISRVGFSKLKAILSIYNDSLDKISELIYEDDYFLSGFDSHKVSLNANSKYYLLVRAIEEEGDPQLDADFGQYRLRVSHLVDIPDDPPPPIDDIITCPFGCTTGGNVLDIVRCKTLSTSSSTVDVDGDDDDEDAYSIDVYSPYYNPDEDGDGETNIVLVEPLDFTLIDIDDALLGGGSIGGGGIPDTPSPRIAFYADFEWLPEIKNILFNNESSYLDLVKHLDKLKYTIPFGSSPMLDSLQELSVLLSKADYKKTIYMLTDNSDNTSSISLTDAIEYINGIDGDGNVPVVIGNISNVYPITLSSLVSRTDTEGIDFISRQTKGRSFTILSEEFLDDFVDLSVARGAGSVGFGEFYYVFDLKKLSMINSMSVSFFVPEYSDANWSFATSVDGINYTEFSKEFNYNETADFDDLSCKYIKWHIQLIHLLKPAEDGTLDIPSLSGFNLSISVDKDSFIFMNKEAGSSSVQQLIATTLSSVPNNSSLEIGVGSGESSEWKDFYSRSQESVNEDGKVFVPIRSTMSNDDNPEPLISIDDLVFEPFYGPWDVNSDFTIVDFESGQVDKNDYRVYPRRGIVVFTSYQRNRSFNIFIDPPSTFRVAVKVTNKKPDTQVSLDGVAYQYNTNIFLPSQYTNRPPVAYDLKVYPEHPGIYSPISASYRYADLNGDPEDKEKTEIRWYINGVEFAWLKNVTRFNDLDNPLDSFYSNVGTFSLGDVVRLQYLVASGYGSVGDTPEQTAALRGESIFQIGDDVYFTVKPHDGFRYGDIAYSNTITIVETPPFLTRLEVKGRRIDSLLPTDRYTTGTQLFADFDYFSPSEQNNSVIRWFVNDNIFKEGLLNEASDDNIINTTLNPGELSTATGVAVHAFDIGNVVYCEIMPVGSNTQGDTVQSQTVVIENEIPSISIIRLNGLGNQNGTASINDTLTVSYVFHDTDLDFNSGQTDQTVIQWLVSSGGSSFVEFELPAGSDPKILYASNTISGQVWKVRLTPFDGVGQGDVSDTVEITIL